MGYEPPVSILLGGIAGLSGGFIFAWWGSKEPTVTKVSGHIQREIERTDDEIPSQRINSQRSRRTTRRYRRRAGINVKFWER